MGIHDGMEEPATTKSIPGRMNQNEIDWVHSPFRPPDLSLEAATHIGRILTSPQFGRPRARDFCLWVNGHREGHP